MLILIGVLCILYAAAHPYFDNSLISGEYITGTSQSESITLRNTLNRPISFSFKPLSEDVDPLKKILVPGEKAIFSKDDHIEIRLPAESSGLLYWLIPGEHYVIKELGEEGIGLFKLIKGSSSIINLAPHVPGRSCSITTLSADWSEFRFRHFRSGLW